MVNVYFLNKAYLYKVTFRLIPSSSSIPSFAPSLPHRKTVRYFKSEMSIPKQKLRETR